MAPPRGPKLVPSFFKIMIGDFRSELLLPAAFVKKLKDKLPENPKLIVQGGKAWRVTMEKRGEDRFFTRGWTGFADHNNLKLGEFLVFLLTTKSTFRVVVYGLNGCLKTDIFARNSSNDRISKKRGIDFAETIKVEDTSDEDDYNITPLSQTFSAVHKHLYQRHMIIPKQFAEETGIYSKRRINLVDLRGRKWPVEIRTRPDTRVDLKDGWAAFREANKLVEGSTYEFAFHPNASDQLRFMGCKRKRGRPPVSTRYL